MKTEPRIPPVPPAHAAIDEILQQCLHHFGVAIAATACGAFSAGFATREAVNRLQAARVLLAKLSEPDAESDGGKK